MFKRLSIAIGIGFVLGIIYLLYFINFNFGYFICLLKYTNLLFSIPIFFILIFFAYSWIYKVILADKYKLFQSLKKVILGSLLLLVLLIGLPFIDFLIKMLIYKHSLELGFFGTASGWKIFLVSGKVLFIVIPSVIFVYAGAAIAGWGFQSKFINIIFIIILIVFIGFSYSNRYDIAMNLGEYFFDTGKKIELFESLLKKDPKFKNYPTALIRTGMWYYDQKQYSEAEQKFSQLIELEGIPDFYKIDAYYRRGISYFETGNPEKGIEDLKRCLEKFPGNIYEKEILFNLSKIYLEKDSPEIIPAKEYLTILNQKYPDSPQMKLFESKYRFILENDDFEFEPLKIYFTLEHKINTPNELEVLDGLQGILQAYPEAKIVDDVMFQIGGIYNRNKDNHNAFITYRDIQNKFPSSPYIEEIKKIMDEIVWKVYDLTSFPKSQEFYYAGKRGTEFYIVTDQGIYFYNESENRFNPYPHDIIPNKRVSSVKFIKNYTIVCTEDGAVRLFNEKQQALNLLYDGKDDAVIHPVVQEINNEFWIGSYNGILVYNPATDTKIKYTNKDGLGSNLVKDILSTGKIIWVATTSGLSRFDTSTKKWLPNVTYADPASQTTLSDFTSLVETQGGSLWAGSKKGIVQYHLREEYSDVHLLLVYVRSLFQMDGYLWVLGVNELTEKDYEKDISVRRINLSSKLVDTYPKGPAKDSFQAYGISEKYLWLGNVWGEVSRFDRKQEKWKIYSELFKDKSSIKSIISVKNGVWILTKEKLAFFDQELENIRER